MDNIDKIKRKLKKIVPTPHDARYMATGDPRPPAPITKTLD